MVYFVSSSLSTLDHIRDTQNKGRKVIWLILFTIVTLLAIYQTADVITSFMQLSMVDIESEEVTTGNDVSVSVCFPMSSKRLPMFGLTPEMLLKFKKLNVSCDVEMPSSLCQSVLTDRERFLIGNHLSSATCARCDTDYDIDEPSTWSNRLFLNNLKFGNCITNDLKDMDTTLGFQYFLNQPMAIVFHQTGTPPVFHNKNFFVFRPIQLNAMEEFKFAVYVKKIVYEVQSWPFTGACVDPQTPIESFAILNQEINKPFTYRYSFESCLDRCLFNLTKSYCNCLVEKLMTHTNDQLLPICPQNCNKIPKIKMDEMCKCKPLCKSVEVSAVAESYLKRNTQAEIYHLITSKLDVYASFKNTSWNDKILHEELLANKQTKAYHKKLHIEQSLVTKMLSKHPLSNFEDAASTIGGIWGIWIGLSVTVIFSMLVKTIPKIEIDYAMEDGLTKTTSLANIIHLTGVVAITSVFFWQMHLFIQDYYRFNVMQVKTTEIQDPASFPFVYICSNGKIFANETILKGNDILKDKVNQLRNIMVEHPEFLHLYYNRLSTDEKMLVSPTIVDIIADCKIITENGQSLPCALEEFKFRLRDTPTVCATVKPVNSTESSIKVIFSRVVYETSTFIRITTKTFPKLFIPSLLL